METRGRVNTVVDADDATVMTSYSTDMVDHALIALA